MYLENMERPNEREREREREREHVEKLRQGTQEEHERENRGDMHLEKHVKRNSGSSGGKMQRRERKNRSGEGRGFSLAATFERRVHRNFSWNNGIAQPETTRFCNRSSTCFNKQEDFKNSSRPRQTKLLWITGVRNQTTGEGRGEREKAKRKRIIVL